MTPPDTFMQRGSGCMLEDEFKERVGPMDATAAAAATTATVNSAGSTAAEGTSGAAVIATLASGGKAESASVPDSLLPFGAIPSPFSPAPPPVPVTSSSSSKRKLAPAAPSTNVARAVPKAMKTEAVTRGGSGGSVQGGGIAPPAETIVIADMDMDIDVDVSVDDDVDLAVPRSIPTPVPAPAPAPARAAPVVSSPTHVHAHAPSTTAKRTTHGLLYRPKY